MTQKDLFPTVTSSQPDTPASHSVSPGSDAARKMTATSGLKYEPLFKQSDPLGAFSRTFMVTSGWDSTKCYLTWKPLTTPHKRSLYQLAVSTRLTDEIASGLWATPNTMDHLPQRSKESTKKMQEGHRKGRKRPSNLREQVNEETLAMWPTPTAMTGGTGVAPSHKNGKHGWNTGAAVNDSLSESPTRMWPTPTVRDHKGGYQGGRKRNGKVSWDTLDVAVQHTDNQQKTGGQLNPQWVEWLMGYPAGWTELED